MRIADFLRLLRRGVTVAPARPKHVDPVSVSPQTADNILVSDRDSVGAEDVETAPRVTPGVRGAYDVGDPCYRLALAGAFTFAKDVDLGDSNEDCWSLVLEAHRAAVFDGATESFAAQRWARLLAEQWAEPSDDWLADAQRAYSQALAGLSLSWAQEAAVARGSHATIAALAATADGLRLEAVGDSCILLVRDEELLLSHPLASSNDFTSAPAALSTDGALLERCWQALTAGTRLVPATEACPTHAILVTDAVAAWLLDDDPDARQARLLQLMGISKDEEFADLIASERQAHRMKVDDSTAVVLRIEGTS